MLWELTFLLGKVALEALPVTSIILLRCSFSALALLPFALRRDHRPRRQDLPLFLLTGALQVPVTYLSAFRTSPQHQDGATGHPDASRASARQFSRIGLNTAQ